MTGARRCVVANPSPSSRSRTASIEVELAATEGLAVTLRRDQEVDVSVDAPSQAPGPISKGERIGKAVVSVDGEQVATVALAATRSAAAASLVERYDAAVPGPRAVAWLLAILALAVLFVGGVAALGSAAALRVTG